MAGVQAGRLSIEIVAEIARLQQDLDKAKRAVRSMSNDIARDARAANDNLSRMGTGFQGTARRVGVAAGSTRAAMQQLSFQLGDIAQGFAMGTRPMTIFAQQSGQVIQALSLMTNSTKGFLGFMAGPWGLVISAAAVVLVPLISKLLDTEDAVKKVEFASYRLGDAQGILGNVMDMTTGKINTQKDALLALARAQILAGEIQARADMAAARRELGRLAAPGFNLTGGMGGGFNINTNVRRAEAGIIEAFREGSLNTQEAVRGLDSLRRTGMITEQAFIDAAKAVTDFGVAAENLGVFQGAERMLSGQGTAADRSAFLDPARARRQRQRQGPTAEDIARRFNDQLMSITLQSIDAMSQLATTTEERAEHELRALEFNHLSLKRQIAADEDFSAAQKAELTAAAERLADRRRELLDLRTRQELEQQSRQLADAQHQAAAESLEAQLALTGAEAERKALVLQIFDAEQAYLRSRLEAVILSDTANEHAKQLAQLQLDALNATSKARREGVSNANMTSVERFLADLNKTPAQMEEAFDTITMNGLDAFNEGLVDAIVNFRSLGDVAKNVLKQILADLIRLHIQQLIMGTLANALGLGGGGLGGGGDLGVLSKAIGVAGTGLPKFGGGRASGGPVSPGRFYAVNEHSTAPGLFIPIAPGRIEPRGSNDNGRSISINVSVVGAMNERQARATGDQIGRRIKRQLNAR